MANKNLSTLKDQERLQKKVAKLKEAAWKELNEVSGISPLYQNRFKVWKALDSLYSELEVKVKIYEQSTNSRWGISFLLIITT